MKNKTDTIILNPQQSQIFFWMNTVVHIVKQIFKIQS